MNTDKSILLMLLVAATPIGIVLTFLQNLAVELTLRTGEIVAFTIVLTSLAQTLGQAFSHL